MVKILNTDEKWSDEEWSLFKNSLLNLLAEKSIKVTFNKKDGNTRVMLCTLNANLLPAKTITEEKPNRKKSADTIPVYDLEKNDWRSFNLKTIISVES